MDWGEGDVGGGADGMDDVMVRRIYFVVHRTIKIAQKKREDFWKRSAGRSFSPKTQGMRSEGEKSGAAGSGGGCRWKSRMAS